MLQPCQVASHGLRSCPVSASELELLRVWVPRKWKDRLRQLAGDRSISISDLVRIFLREALYGEKAPR